MPPALLVFVTAPSRKEAESLARVLVREKLAACVSIVPKIYSSYWWQGKIEKSAESLLIIKTLSGKFPALSRRIRSVHSYAVPEILAMPVVKGNAEYLHWMKKSLRQ